MLLSQDQYADKYGQLCDAIERIYFSDDTPLASYRDLLEAEFGKEEHAEGGFVTSSDARAAALAAVEQLDVEVV